MSWCALGHRNQDNKLTKGYCREKRFGEGGDEEEEDDGEGFGSAKKQGTSWVSPVRNFDWGTLDSLAQAMSIDITILKQARNKLGGRDLHKNDQVGQDRGA